MYVRLRTECNFSRFERNQQGSSRMIGAGFHCSIQHSGHSHGQDYRSTSRTLRLSKKIEPASRARSPAATRGAIWYRWALTLGRQHQHRSPRRIRVRRRVLPGWGGGGQRLVDAVIEPERHLVAPGVALGPPVHRVRGDAVEPRPQGHASVAIPRQGPHRGQEHLGHEIVRRVPIADTPENVPGDGVAVAAVDLGEGGRVALRTRYQRPIRVVAEPIQLTRTNGQFRHNREASSVAIRPDTLPG